MVCRALEGAMADRTAARRVKKYREIQRESRGIRRIEVQVPSLVAEDVKGLGRRPQDAFKKAAADEKPTRSVLEIGRASGRERVCQNVSIWGVAVQFKTKTNITKKKRTR